jgi:hypothetical protein
VAAGRSHSCTLATYVGICLQYAVLIKYYILGHHVSGDIWASIAFRYPYVTKCKQTGLCLCLPFALSFDLRPVPSRSDSIRKSSVSPGAKFCTRIWDVLQGQIIMVLITVSWKYLARGVPLFIFYCSSPLRSCTCIFLHIGCEIPW